MKPISTDQTKEYRYAVKKEDFAAFQGKVVHPVCSTFTLAREIEWATRQYIFDICEEDEEGVGTLVEIQHHSPAFEQEQLVITSWVEQFERNELICGVKVTVGDRLIATGKTGQKIFKRDKIKKIFSRP